tara:strand:- start:9853 stop:10476 length:624 start_codon:yes stop_codon:yes gene_type:complete
MDRDFFIHLTFAVHRVADVLEEPKLAKELKSSANLLLADLILATENNPLTLEQKRSIVPRAIREVGSLKAYLSYARRISSVSSENFVLLEKEYTKAENFLRDLHQDMLSQDSGARPAPQQKRVAPKRDLGAPKSRLSSRKDSGGELSLRQTRILEIIRNKEKAQVWELQKVLPEVTKRTLRRDIDSLLQQDLIERKGEWNTVFYQVR